MKKVRSTSLSTMTRRGRKPDITHIHVKKEPSWMKKSEKYIFIDYNNNFKGYKLSIQVMKKL